jgi:CheY-like chemotaxis protein
VIWARERAEGYSEPIPGSPAHIREYSGNGIAPAEEDRPRRGKDHKIGRVPSEKAEVRSTVPPKEQQMADILLIEDDEQVRSIMRKMLEQLGHSVRVAENGEEGLSLFQSEPSGFVITDLLMPRKEGLETIKELRALAPDVRILAISGGGVTLTATGCLELARGLGANKILEKPFGMAQLAEAIDALVAIDDQALRRTNTQSS